MSATEQRTADGAERTAGRRVSTRTLYVGLLVAALVVAGVVSYWASGHPDGLEFVADKTGFSDSAQDSATSGSPFADYQTTGVDEGWLSGAIPGVLGTLLVLLVAGGAAWVVRRRGADQG